jgi:hypothetical protein
MSYSKSLLLYQDDPAYGLLLKLIVVIVPGGLLVTSIYLWFSGEDTGGLVMLSEAFFIGLVFWIVFPRKYQVYDDHLRIVLGGPFAVKIGFDRITAIEVTNRMGLTINFVTRFTWTYVRIMKRNGLDIAITPKSNELFADNANRALSEWARIKAT